MMVAVAKLFGHQFNLRENCLCDGEVIASDPYINLYVRITDMCPCSCPFCTFHSEDSEVFFDHDKFRLVLSILKSMITVNKIVFTGGEPSCDFGAFLTALKEVRAEFPKVHVTVNTNGEYLQALGDPETLDRLSCVALSRHHHHDHRNAVAFGVVNISPSDLERIEAFPDKDKLHLRCNLINGYIDCPEMAAEYMDEMSKLGVKDFGFVSLMKVNSYCKENFIENLDFMKLPGMFMSKAWKRPDGRCTCRNYFYVTASGNLVKLYDRLDDDPSNSYGNLVYDVNRLLTGFGGSVIM